MTTTIKHTDTTVRVDTFYGVNVLIADDPDTADDYCLSCDTATTPVIAIVIIDDEQWEAAPNVESMCPACGSTDLARWDDADTILRQRAEDNDADRRYHERKDDGF